MLMRLKQFHLRTVGPQVYFAVRDGVFAGETKIRWVRTRALASFFSKGDATGIARRLRRSRLRLRTRIEAAHR